jgi:DNA polymerase-3 subunit alpha
LRSAASNGDKNQDDLFGEETARELILRDTDPWLPMERLDREHDAIGFYVSGHPLDEYESILQSEGIISWAEFCSRAGKRASVTRLAAIVSARQERTSAKGNRYAFIGLSDQSGQYEAIAFSELLASCNEALTPGTAVLVEIEAEAGGDAMRARLTSAVPLDTIAGRAQSGIRIGINDIASLEKLRTHLSPTGQGEVRIVLKLADVEREVELQMPGRYDVSPRGTGAISVIEGVTGIEPIPPSGASGRSGGRGAPSLSLAKS